MSEIEKMIEDFKNIASEKEKKLLELYPEYSTEKISIQEFFKETSELEFPAPDFYIACILGALMKSVVSLEKSAAQIKNKRALNKCPNAETVSLSALRLGLG